MVFNLRTFSFAESVEEDPTPTKSFSLKELRRATDNFSSSNDIEGYFGSGKVCKGRLADGSLVSVHRASYVDLSSEEGFEAEVQVGSTVSTHPNVLRLRGFCRIEEVVLLVYPLMINNSLSYNLTERPDRFARPLDWTTRKRIALGAARGLAHLHNQGNIKILHRHFHASNILLNVHFEAVIGGFSLAEIMHENNAEEGTIVWPMRSSDSGSDSRSYHRYEDVYVNTITVDGIFEYIAPEYIHSGKCTVKNDVYAYGKMLLELMSGTDISKLNSLAVDEDLSLEKWIGDLKNKNELGRVIDPNLQGNYVEEEAERLVGFALLCSHVDPSIRPQMSEVVRMLESQFLQRDPSTRSSWSQSEGDSTRFAESVKDDPTPPKSFSLKELRRATDNFSSSNNTEGYFGSGKVYKGRLADGSLVAVHRASYVDLSSKEIFEAEVQVGSTVSTHPNVLRLRGFCRTKKEILLVYPLMINNSLSYNLTERPDRFARPLDWTTRKRIALGAARGLAHLHNQGNIKILHRHISPRNILLNVHFEAVIGGFSLAKIMHENNAEEGTIVWPMRSSDSGSDSRSYHRYEDVYVNTTSFCGRFIYCAPEYLFTGKCTVKNDVYAYGKMLLELMSGTDISKLNSLAVDEDLSLEKWIGDLKNKNELGRVIDPNLQGNYVEEEAERLVGFALLCSHVDPSIRPQMSEVVRMLESQFLQRDPSTRSSWSQSEGDSTRYYSFPPSPSPLGIAP